ncbi:MAG: hypothetical protein JW787_13405 [Sedimentisphaerales bacterium]|nr:hypothetical protein [Sedimentisphaerales bacterium]
MRKVWIYKRKNINGWWIGWYESNQRRAKALPTKAHAEHYRQIKYTQLNSDVFTGIVVAEWLQMTEEYYKNKTVEGLTESSIYEISLTLRNFLRLTNIISSKQLTQRLLEHSSPILTQKIYTNVDPLLRQSINKLPIEQWL